MLPALRPGTDSMPKLRAVVIAFTACALLPLATLASPPTRSEAQLAYDAGEYASCAALYAQVADAEGGTRADGYNAACCLALAGNADAAFERLRTTVTTHFTSVADLQQDEDFRSLRDDPRWEPMLALARQEEDRHLAGTDRALRRELFERLNRDQEIRDRLIAAPEDKALIAEAERIDTDNTAWLKQVVASRGWPGYKLVHEDGAQAAWLLAQHADRDPAFQQQVLELLEKAVLDKDAKPSHLAYLTDRVRTGRDEKQLYGTQFIKAGDDWVPAPIEDEAHVDERRQRIGLGTLAEYAEQIRAAYSQ